MLRYLYHANLIFTEVTGILVEITLELNNMLKTLRVFIPS